MVTGYDWDAIGKALLSLSIMGAILQSATLWAFHRLAALTQGSVLAPDHRLRHAVALGLVGMAMPSLGATR